MTRRLLDGPRSRTMTAAISIDRYATFLDRPRPFLDLAGDKALQIAGAGAIRGDQIGADLFHALSQRRRAHLLDSGFLQTMDDGVRSAVREKQADPVVGLEARIALLPHRRHIGQHRRALP